MKLTVFILLLFSLVSCKKDKLEMEPATDYGPHPRLLLQDNDEELINDLISSDPTWQALHAAILREANKILSKSPLQRKLTGRRLLSVSRECLRRVYFLSYAFRMTGDMRFLDGAEKVMLDVARFSDWNPSHFLDVAEMTMGLAIGFDWLHAELSIDSKTMIAEAIKTKGLEPSYNPDYNWFVRSTNNWNQVCNAGMTFGALAVADLYPDLARHTIERAIESIELPMSVYQPDGAYPEGYGYWGYGTTMNVLFLDVLEKTMGSDFGLSSTPGFLETSQYLKHMLGPSLSCFNWGDNRLGGSLKPAMFWFANRMGDPSVLWMEKNFLKATNFDKYARGQRLLPSALLWAKNIPIESISEPSEKMWVGQGDNPVALMRTSWSDPDAIYLGFKAGSPSVNHGHMDIGSFVMESDGIRWATDLGVQNYESLESKGLKIFGKTQDAQRWTVFRFNNFSHSTLTVDEKLQRVKGHAKIDRHSDDPSFRFAISDITSIYDGQLQSATRGAGIVKDQYVLVRDEVTTLEDFPVKVRWQVVTTADVQLNSSGAILQQGGEKLILKVQGIENLQMQIWSTEPTNDYDAPNPGSLLLGFEQQIPANSSRDWQVAFIPEKNMETVQIPSARLDAW